MHQTGDVAITLGRVGVGRVEHPVADGLELVRGQGLRVVRHRHAGLRRAIRRRRLSEEFLPAQRAGGQDDDGLGGHDDRVTVELHRATAVCGLRKAVGVKVGAGCCDACLVELGVLQESGDVELSARWQHCVRDRRCGRQDGGGDVIQQHWKPAHQSQGRNDPDLPRRSMSWSSKRTPLKGGAPN